MRTRVLVTSVMVVLMGCAPGATDGPTNAKRGALGKADIVGSCFAAGDNYCGGKSAGSCWCDEECVKYGDCCDDFEPVCEPTYCGGLANTACPSGQTCVDYPYDSCDPDNGGRDCSGYCVAATADETPQPQPCGGPSGLTCGPNHFCSYTPEQSCGVGGQTGTCEVMPDACILTVDPVCGCDGHTYSNVCVAERAGASVAHKGACDAPAPAPAAQSCQGRCGGQSEDQSCWCDSSCATYGDCCADAQAVCGG